jgi:hypothetical protein
MPGRRWVRRKHAAVVLCLALFGALVAGCSGSGTQYVSNSGDHTYFKVPAGWKLYDEKAVVDSMADLSPEQRDHVLDTSWRTVFDANPKPSLGHFAKTGSKFPAGYAVVATNSSDTQDQISDQSMRNQFLAVDELSNAGQLTVLGYDSVNKGNGLHGIRIRARVTSKPDSEIYPQGDAFTFEQISLTDQTREKSYSLIVMCSSRCFEKHADRIEGIVDSWTVTDG